MVPRVQLLSIATALPPHRISQREAAEAAARGFASRYMDFERLAKVFETSGIRHRHAVRPVEWYLEPMGWPERTAAFIEGASNLFVDAAQKALAQAGVEAGAVDAIVTVSSTGIATPSLEARVAGRLGFRTDIQRVPVFGLGCAGGVSGLHTAAQLARAAPGSLVLLVVVELCTLAFRLDELSKANIVATALFGDGCAACLLQLGQVDGVADVGAGGQHLWPETLDIMGWRVDPEGFGVIFDRAIPPFAQANVGPAVDGFLARLGRRREDVQRFACHPGGVKVIDALETTLDLPSGTLDHERAVLGEAGNMSAPTALFVLERLIAAGLRERTVLMALGPGFTASFLELSGPR